MQFKEVDPSTFTLPPFEAFGRRHPVLCAGTPERHNAMTIGWGSLGNVWKYLAATVYVQPTRHTHDFMERSDTFSLCWLDPERHRRAIAVMGSMSGSDGDKYEAAGLAAKFVDGTPVVAESELVLVCRKVYAHDFERDSILDEDARERIYGDGWAPHTVYVGEVLHAYVREEA